MIFSPCNELLAIDKEKSRLKRCVGFSTIRRRFLKAANSIFAKPTEVSVKIAKKTAVFELLDDVLRRTAIFLKLSPTCWHFFCFAREKIGFCNV